ncbi:CAP-associated domain-containing protein [Metabacillus halosaccharovorans]|uniref:CAP domain-containing protein n=1 Tax=Metabacillus halosaccharovorans TaxID=930124 RepID=UPI001C1F3D23|nr:CAP-associated domain-containing protein [Metabacillus halosaccharovorans]MBU7595954.1 serine protease [Metabacillus halosaccharovorans]
MPRVQNIVALLLFAGGFWYFYGETFNQAGIQGVVEEVRTDITEIKENPEVISAINKVSNDIEQLFQRFIQNLPKKEGENQQVVEPPKLETPSEQSFSVYNIEIGDTQEQVEQQVGAAKRSSLNEYGVEWVAYHENYQNFFMVAYDDQDRVAGLYTNQDLLTTTMGISFTSSREAVLAEMDDPLTSIQKGFVSYQVQNNEEYDIFRIDRNYVTVFYDKHEENTVTAIQIISEELENQRENFFAVPSEELREGFEYQLFDLTNAARVTHGLSVLNWDEPVRGTARDHSQDMANNNYFSHTNLNGQSPFDRMTEDNITYLMAGENLATGQISSVFAHEGLMNSLGHRENILQTDFEGLGIGVAFSSDSRPYYTENFLTK